MNYDELYNELEEHFNINDKTIKRFIHSVSVKDMALKINHDLNLGLNEDDLINAAMLHDYLKIYTNDELIKMYQEKCPDDLDTLKSPNTIHAIMAPIVLKEKYPHLSDEVLSAIQYHTTAKPNMTTIEKVIYCADAVEDTRDYSDLRYYQKLSCTNLDQAVYEILDYTINDLKKRRVYIHPLTINAFEYYKKQNLVEPYLNKVETYLKSTILTDVTLYHTKEISPFFDYLIIATSSNERLAKAAIEHLRDLAIENDIVVLGYSKENTSGWYIIDMNNILVHVFLKEERTRYNLDGMYYNLNKEVIE